MNTSISRIGQLVLPSVFTAVAIVWLLGPLAVQYDYATLSPGEQVSAGYESARLTQGEPPYTLVQVVGGKARLKSSDGKYTTIPAKDVYEQ